MIQIPEKGFFLCKFEVSQGLWIEVTDGMWYGERPPSFQDSELPVFNVSASACDRFIEQLNKRPEVIASGFKYRLPTKEEWQYACRAGTSGHFCKLADGTEITDDNIERVAWYSGAYLSHSGIHHVGRKEPNAFGLYDMQGNVAEWTSNHVACGGDVESMADELGWNDSRTYEFFWQGFRLAADKVEP
jgi:formylglycine-generating enzyme required for sulfatase activity